MGDVFDLQQSPSNNHPASWKGRDTTSPSDVTQQARREIAEYHEANQKFGGMEPDEVLHMISSITARLSYLRDRLMSDGGQQANRVRTHQLDPLMSNLDLQFRIHSRLLTARQFDYEVTRGAAT